MDAEIIAVGSEMLTAHGQETNSLYLTGKLNSLGIEVRFKTVVGDDHDRLASVLEDSLKRSGIVIVTGGLGPTEDDITRDVLSDVTGRALRENGEVRSRIEKRFQRLGRSMPPNNLRQAMIPEGAEWIENANGSAPGLWLDHQGVILILLPGPPWELEAMFEASCMARLERFAGSELIRTRVYKIIGLPESEVDRRIAPLYKPYTNPLTTLLAKPGAIEVHLRARAASDQEAEGLLSELGDKLEVVLGDQVFSTRGETLEEVVGMYLVM
ncbi:MAG: competence/damage-inducible protein A, partial [Terriglobia bacterium]